VTDLLPGSRGALRLETVPCQLHFKVCEIRDDGAHVAFELDAKAAAELPPVLERLIMRNAA